MSTSWEQNAGCRQTYSNRFACTPFSHDEHTANFGVYNVQQNRKLHILLPSYFDKREGWDSFDRLCPLCNNCCNSMALQIGTLLKPPRLQNACPALAGPNLGSAQRPAIKVLGSAVLQRARVKRLRWAHRCHVCASRKRYLAVQKHHLFLYAGVSVHLHNCTQIHFTRSLHFEEH